MMFLRHELGDKRKGGIWITYCNFLCGFGSCHNLMGLSSQLLDRSPGVSQLSPMLNGLPWNPKHFLTMIYTLNNCPCIHWIDTGPLPFPYFLHVEWLFHGALEASDYKTKVLRSQCLHRKKDPGKRGKERCLIQPVITLLTPIQSRWWRGCKRAHFDPSPWRISLSPYGCFSLEGHGYFINSTPYSPFLSGYLQGANKKEITLVCLFSFNLFIRIMQDTLALMRFFSQSYYWSAYLAQNVGVIKRATWEIIASRGDCTYFQFSHDLMKKLAYFIIIIANKLGFLTEN